MCLSSQSDAQRFSFRERNDASIDYSKSSRSWGRRATPDLHSTTNILTLGTIIFFRSNRMHTKGSLFPLIYKIFDIFFKATNTKVSEACRAFICCGGQNVNFGEAPWEHVACRGCSRCAGCSPGRGMVRGERTEPAAGACRPAVEGRTGPPGRTFPAAPWGHGSIPPPAAGSKETTKSPPRPSAPPGNEEWSLT